MVKIIKEQTPVATKNYTCDFCEILIRAGEKYNRIFARVEGEPPSEYTVCGDCRPINQKGVE